MTKGDILKLLSQTETIPLAEGKKLQRVSKRSYEKLREDIMDKLTRYNKEDISVINNTIHNLFKGKQLLYRFETSSGVIYIFPILIDFMYLRTLLGQVSITREQAIMEKEYISLMKKFSKMLAIDKKDERPVMFDPTNEIKDSWIVERLKNLGVDVDVNKYKKMIFDKIILPSKFKSYTGYFVDIDPTFTRSLFLDVLLKHLDVKLMDAQLKYILNTVSDMESINKDVLKIEKEGCIIC